MEDSARRSQRAMSFGAVAPDYDRLRPPPAPAAVDWLLPERCEVAVDVAAGTGLLTRALVSRVGRVVAVEPDERMRAVLAERSPDVQVLEGRGEALPLPDASADAVLVSSAWHWMDPVLAAHEIGRVLRAGGRFGLVWTSRDREVDWLRDLDRMVRTTTADDHRSDDWLRRRVREVGVPDDGLFTNVDRASFGFAREMAAGDVVDMLATYSAFITANEQERDATLSRARAALAARFPGAVTIEVPMRSWCWRADRAAA